MTLTVCITLMSCAEVFMVECIQTAYQLCEDTAPAIALDRYEGRRR